MKSRSLESKVNSKLEATAKALLDLRRKTGSIDPTETLINLLCHLNEEDRGEALICMKELQAHLSNGGDMPDINSVISTLMDDIKQMEGA